jgi:hypothetical protein
MKTGPSPTQLDLHLKEADWAYQEMGDFVRLTERYRSLYLTAIFAALGWLLGQISRSGQSVDLRELMGRSDVAAVVCGLAPLNVLFFSLILEATAKVQSLARYRFLLGWTFGAHRPSWGWEVWREGEGSIRHWTNPTNIFFGVFGLLGTLLLLGFPIPAVVKGDWPLVLLYAISVVFSLALLVVVIRVAWKNRHRNAVAHPPSNDWWLEMHADYRARYGLHEPSTPPVSNTPPPTQHQDPPSD